MKLGLLKRVTKDALQGSGNLPKWIDALLEPINNFIENVGLALQGGLTFEDNFLCKIVSQSFTHEVETKVNPFREDQRNLRVVGVMPLSASGKPIDKFGWTRKSDGSIGVTISFAAPSSNLCTILILLGD